MGKIKALMETMLGKANGVASLNSDGKLADEQIPSLEKMGAVDYIKNLPFTRKNLLDNWYFADPIDQRGGYVVPPGIAYYENVGDATHIGLTDTYYTAKSDSSGSYSITVNGATYYVSPSNVVCGYTGAGYTIDRWAFSGLSNAPATVLIESDCVRLLAANSFRQPIENPYRFAGKKLTLSMLIGGVTTGAGSIGFVVDDAWIASTPLPTTTQKTLISVTADIPSGLNTLKAWYYGGEGTDYRVYAAKLELGSTQTLARNIGTEEQPNWVLNDPPPNKALELAKCQRYYQLFSSADTRPKNLADYRPTMRANPALGTININGQTMYFADANL